MNNQLIPVFAGELSGLPVQLVDARLLHKFLGVKDRFRNWINKRIEEYGFIADLDFRSFLSESTGGRPSNEYHLTIDMTKELGMIERTEKGRQIRRYFLEMERHAHASALPVLHFPISAADTHDREFANDCLSPRKLLDARNRQLELELIKTLEDAGLDIEGLKMRILALRGAAEQAEQLRQAMQHLHKQMNSAAEIANNYAGERGKNVLFKKSPDAQKCPITRHVYRDQNLGAASKSVCESKPG